MTTSTKRLVLVESPFKARTTLRNEALHDVHLNKQYARSLCRFVAVQRGDYPLASHLFCTQFLDDNKQNERELGIEIGFAWGAHADYTVVGIDRGISSGVIAAIRRARDATRPIVWLSLSTFHDSWIPTDVFRAGWKAFRLSGDDVVTHQGEI